jgi:hypothetical protein
MCHLKHKLVFFLLLFTHLYNYIFSSYHLEISHSLLLFTHLYTYIFSSYHLEISHSLLLFTHLYNYIFITLTVIIWRLTYLCFPQVRQRNPELLPQCSSQTENVQLLRNGLRWCRGEHDLIRPKFCHRRANVKLVRHRPQGHTHKSSNPTHEVSRGWLRLVRQRPRQLPKRSQRPSLQVQEAVKKPKRPLRLRQTPISPSSRYFVCLFLFVKTSKIFFNYCCSVCLWESATYVIVLFPFVLRILCTSVRFRCWLQTSLTPSDLHLWTHLRECRPSTAYMRTLSANREPKGWDYYKFPLCHYQLT